MNNKTLTYIHMFKTGNPLTVTVDLSNETPKITCSREIAQEEDEEYVAWRSNILAPQILDACTEEQQMAIITKGFKQSYD